jgi:RecG-like helicase
MRPAVLNPLFASLSSLPGIGPKLEKLYSRLLDRDNEPSRLVDLLFHLPTGFVDRSNQPKLSEVTPSRSTSTGRPRHTGRVCRITSRRATTPTR